MQPTFSEQTPATRLQAVRETIRRLENRYRRTPGSVRLLAVSKKKSAEEIIDAASAGQRDFGESYLQEALKKIAALKDQDLCWHFVGPIQKNKTRQIAAHFSWVHGIERVIVAERLSTQRPDHLPPLQVCLQVNIDRELSKSGLQYEQVPDIASALQELPNLKLRGLMAIPRRTSDTIHRRLRFAQLRALLEQLNQSGFGLDTLSMGMSGDLEDAVAEGATIVRIGTAIFGARTAG
ncbi:MAG: YggS family pyridoxal phosphate-dependent enzyme [Proteobacteria bacterium]|nr:YggS family pyridoxal phosphate-dependent enzyme [Pseudomonadota bacterium]